MNSDRSLRKRRIPAGLIICLAVVFFLTGLVAGLVIMSYISADKEAEPAALTEDVEQEEVNVLNVYVPARERVYGSIPVNPYIQDNFRIEDGYMAYYDENGEKISHLGLDISYHQESVDWEKLSGSAVEFIMLRCGYRGYSEGGLVKDEKFDEYARAANDAGIPLGVYFFTQAVNVDEAAAEAEFVLSLIEKYEISYPVALDTEYVNDIDGRVNKAGLSREDQSRICIAFLERIKEEGYYPMIYAGENWIRRNLDYEMLADYDFWASQYLSKNDFMYDFTIWQYTANGGVPGIDEDVDLDISLVDYASFVPKLRQAVLSGGEIGSYTP